MIALCFIQAIIICVLLEALTRKPLQRPAWSTALLRLRDWLLNPQHLNQTTRVRQRVTRTPPATILRSPLNHHQNTSHQDHSHPTRLRRIPRRQDSRFHAATDRNQTRTSPTLHPCSHCRSANRLRGPTYQDMRDLTQLFAETMAGR